MAAENDNTEQGERDPASFELDGQKYEMPELRDLDIDEWMVVYRYSKVVLRDLMEITDDPEAEQARVDKLEQPGVMKALFHIAYKRAHPKKTDAAVEALVGQIKYLPTLEQLNPEEESEEEDPTEETTEPESEPSEPKPSSEKSSDSLTANGSSASTPSSVTPEEEPATTGMSG